MEISLKPDVEAGLERIALNEGRPAQQLVQELVEKFLDYDAWFRGEVEKGIAELDRGESVPHRDVEEHIQPLLRS